MPIDSAASTASYGRIPDPLDPELARKIRRLQGPILVLGGSGFVGARLTHMLLQHRDDVYATATQLPTWRLEGVPAANLRQVDLLVEANLDRLLDDVRPRTLFDCIAYGAYSFETDAQLIYRTNFNFTAQLLARLETRNITSYVHAGSSSEYGDNATAPREDAPLAPNSDYAVSKVASAALIHFYGRKRRLPCANLRLYSVFGPLEDSARLIPQVVTLGLQGRYPPLVDPTISRDFLYVDDAAEAFIDVALELREEDYGESFNIGTGRKTTIGDLANLAQELFRIPEAPSFSMPNRRWDVPDWYADVTKVKARVGWEARTLVRDGLARTIAWYESVPDKSRYARASKKYGLDAKHSVSAIIACYKDGQAIPIMYRRLRDTFASLQIEYEIIFVNDCSPDDSEEVIRALSRTDARVLGVSHSRNFGSQSAFRSGMELATKNAVVLLDGDLQDPPELISAFVERWRAGYDVVYGRRVKREAPWYMQIAYPAFYRLFDRFSYIPIPRDAGDFSLMDRRVVQSLLQFPERDLFMRGIRAFAGFRQTGVDYVRPERMFGVSTNNLLKNFGWAKKGILSFSNAPLNFISSLGFALFAVSVILAVLQTVLRIGYPELAPKGVTTTILLILFFGSINVLSVAVVGEYIAKIFDEVKRRPHFIRRSIIRDGEVRAADEAAVSAGR
jgi:dolichol-phosphate mannosyltransferase